MACGSDDDVAFGELGYVGGFNDELFENGDVGTILGTYVHYVEF